MSAHRIIADEEIAAEIERFHAAVERAQRAAAPACATRAEAHAGPEEAAIFDVQISILDDRELTQQRRVATSGRTSAPRRRSTS